LVLGTTFYNSKLEAVEYVIDLILGTLETHEPWVEGFSEIFDECIESVLETQQIFNWLKPLAQELLRREFKIVKVGDLAPSPEDERERKRVKRE